MLLIVLAAAALGAGGAWLVLHKGELDGPATAAAEADPNGPTTSSVEAATVDDLAREVAAQYDGARMVSEECDGQVDWRAPTADEDWDACLEDKVEPIKDSTDEAAREIVDELKPDVGPKCLRALRSAPFSLDTAQFELPEDGLKAAARVCRQESAS
jgi:hypothetical protein